MFCDLGYVDWLGGVEFGWLMVCDISWLGFWIGCL